jgi:transcriptional regulator of NAD metabolism
MAENNQKFLNNEDMTVINRQVARCLGKIRQVIEPHDIVIDAVQQYIIYTAIDFKKRGLDNK